MGALRVMLADDHAFYRKGVAATLANQGNVEIVAEAGDGLEAIHQARITQPDVVFMDVHMPGCSGIEAARCIKRDLPATLIFMLTVSDDDQDLREAIQVGAQGYLLKDISPEDFINLLSVVRDRGAAFSGSIAAKMLNQYRQTAMTNAVHTLEGESLSEREIEVLRLVGKGCSNKDIADILSLSENTIKIHLRNIFEKMHFENRIQAAVYAVRQGLTE